MNEHDFDRVRGLDVSAEFRAHIWAAVEIWMGLRARLRGILVDIRGHESYYVAEMAQTIQLDFPVEICRE